MNHDHPEWAIRCPWCRASPGQRCTTPTGRRLTTTASHDARRDAHRTQTESKSEATT